MKRLFTLSLAAVLFAATPVFSGSPSEHIPQDPGKGRQRQRGEEANKVAYLGQEIEPVGEVIGVRGEARILRGGRALAVVEHVAVLRDDEIRTAGRARVKVLFNDNSIVTIGQSSRVKLSEYVEGSGGQRGKSRVKLMKGTVRSVVGGHSVDVETASAVATAMGTDFFVRASGEFTEVLTVESKVRVRSANQEITDEVVVEAGFVTRVYRDQPPIDPERFTRDLLGDIRLQTVPGAAEAPSGSGQPEQAAAVAGSRGAGQGNKSAGISSSQPDAGSSGKGSGSEAASGDTSAGDAGMGESGAGESGAGEASGGDAGGAGDGASPGAGGAPSFSGMGADALGDLEGAGEGDAAFSDSGAAMVPDMTEFRAFENLEDAFVTDDISEEIEQEPVVPATIHLHVDLPPR